MVSFVVWLAEGGDTQNILQLETVCRERVEFYLSYPNAGGVPVLFGQAPVFNRGCASRTLKSYFLNKM